jgi:hypothetical protein
MLNKRLINIYEHLSEFAVSINATLQINQIATNPCQRFHFL